jgi:hypothetical protein
MVWKPNPSPPCKKGCRKIQLPYHNKFESIWEYKESFLNGYIDFPSFIGPHCPICGGLDCYREITPYWRYAIDLFPEFKKELIPITRFLCRQEERTFSLLPIQLIPYLQYTTRAVIGTLLLALGYWEQGQKGFWGASVGVHSDSLITPWLVFCWLGMVLQGFRRAHPSLGRFHDLSDIRTSDRSIAWEEVSSYFLAFGIETGFPWWPTLSVILYRYSFATSKFLFGTASQFRHKSHK